MSEVKFFTQYFLGKFSLIAVKGDVVIKKVTCSDDDAQDIIYDNGYLPFEGSNVMNLQPISKETATKINSLIGDFLHKDENVIVPAQRNYKAIKTLSHYNNVINKSKW